MCWDNSSFCQFFGSMEDVGVICNCVLSLAEVHVRACS